MSQPFKLARFIFISCLLVSPLAVPHAYAGAPGPYLGLSYGWGSDSGGITSSDMFTMITNGFNYRNFTVDSFSSHATSDGGAGRIFAGFKFDPYWSLEFGWSHFPSLPVHAEATGFDQNEGLPYYVDSSLGSIKIDAFDLLVKLSWPMSCYFNVYLKGGGAYIEARSSEQVNLVQDGVVLDTPNTTNVQQRYYPAFGLGVSYDITGHFVADLSYLRIQKIKSQDIGSTNLISFGFSWYFGPESI